MVGAVPNQFSRSYNLWKILLWLHLSNEYSHGGYRESFKKAKLENQVSSKSASKQISALDSVDIDGWHDGFIKKSTSSRSTNFNPIDGGIRFDNFEI